MTLPLSSKLTTSGQKRISKSSLSGSMDASSSESNRENLSVKQCTQGDRFAFQSREGVSCDTLNSRNCSNSGSDYEESDNDSYSSSNVSRFSGSAYAPNNSSFKRSNGGLFISVEDTTKIDKDVRGVVSKMKDMLDETKLVGHSERTNLEEVLVRFEKNFIPYLQNKGKLWQAEAEVKNLEHICKCANYMLNDMKFRPEFVAKIAATRLGIAMFGAGDLQGKTEDYGEIISTVRGNYQPSCMWDFGEERTTIKLEGVNYHSNGVLASPSRTSEQQNSVKSDADEQLEINKFSVFRGYDTEGTLYQMLDNSVTVTLSARFRQYLAHKNGEHCYINVTDVFDHIPNQLRSEEYVENWLSIAEYVQNSPNVDASGLIERVQSIFTKVIGDGKKSLSWSNKNAPLRDLHPSLMFLVGMQMGQICGGSWNPFTLAAKRYLYCQLKSEAKTSGSFFWKGLSIKEPSSEGQEEQVFAFKDLINRLGEGVNFDSVARQFETAICSYYALNQEILSRTQFDQNVQRECKIQKIFRLETLDALTEMEILKVEKKDDNNPRPPNENENLDDYKIDDGKIQKKWRSAVLISASTTAPIKTLDKKSQWPKFSRAITLYEDVHHACIFANHLFNMDFNDASRLCNGELISSNERVRGKIQQVSYTKGAPFFKDYQREVLLITPSLQAPELVGILAYAPTSTECYVLSAENKIKHIPSAEVIKRRAKKRNLAEKNANQSENPKETGRDLRELCVEFCEGNQQSFQELLKKNPKQGSDLKRLWGQISAIRQKLGFNKIYRIR